MKETEAIEIVKKQKSRRPARSEELSVQTEPGEMSLMLQNALAIYELPRIDTDDPAQVDERITEYFRLCVERDMKPSVAGMAMALGVDRRTLWTWVTGQRNKPTKVVDTIKRAYLILNSMMEEWMQNGKINPVSGIFLMKNNFGYADKSEVVVTPNQPLGEPKSREEIEQRYLESVDDGDTVYDDENV